MYNKPPFASAHLKTFPLLTVCVLWQGFFLSVKPKFRAVFLLVNTIGLPHFDPWINSITLLLYYCMFYFAVILIPFRRFPRVHDDDDDDDDNDHLACERERATPPHTLSRAHFSPLPYHTCCSPETRSACIAYGIRQKITSRNNRRMSSVVCFFPTRNSRFYPEKSDDVHDTLTWTAV